MVYNKGPSIPNALDALQWGPLLAVAVESLERGHLLPGIALRVAGRCCNRQLLSAIFPCEAPKVFIRAVSCELRRD